MMQPYPGLPRAGSRAARAYQASDAHRGLRAREADVFRRVLGGLRAARQADPITRTRALADNRRLWIAVVDMVQDSDNALPVDLRAAIASVGLSVQREMDQEKPDFDFLIAVNENIADGLNGPS